jgi:hypothetical protein
LVAIGRRLWVDAYRWPAVSMPPSAHGLALVLQVYCKMLVFSLARKALRHTHTLTHTETRGTS